MLIETLAKFSGHEDESSETETNVAQQQTRNADDNPRHTSSRICTRRGIPCNQTARSRICQSQGITSEYKHRTVLIN